MKNEIPPHIIDSTPLISSQTEKAKGISRRFLSAGSVFASSSADKQRKELCKLKKYCDKWLIDAYKSGLLPPSQTELVELIEWYLKDDETIRILEAISQETIHSTDPYYDKSKYMKILYTDREHYLNSEDVFLGRYPVSLFDDICGGNLNIKYPLASEGRVGVGGLLPRILPGHLDQPVNLRYAATCEWIASILALQDTTSDEIPLSDHQRSIIDIIQPEVSEVAIIALRKDIKGEEKMMYIDKIDNLAWTWKPSKWAELLKVTPSAISQYKYYKNVIKPKQQRQRI